MRWLQQEHEIAIETVDVVTSWLRAVTLLRCVYEVERMFGVKSDIHWHARQK